MKLEDQVVSLELAKRLKELGVKQESLFWWWLAEDRSSGSIFSEQHKYCENVSAFTVAELGEMLSQGGHHFLPSYNSNYDHGWYYKFFEAVPIHEQKLADCMAKMLIYLIENNLITPTH